MKRYNVIIMAIIFIFLFSNSSVAQGEKTILVLLDQLDFNMMEEITDGIDFGAGFVNIKTRRPQGDESLFFSIALGRKVGLDEKYYKGLEKAPDGSIAISGFQDMLDNLNTLVDQVEDCLLGERLKDIGISYIGDNSSALIAADKTGHIKSGEIEIVYDREWLFEKLDNNLSNSNLLILSFQVEGKNERIELLQDLIEEYKDFNILMLPQNVPESIKYVINRTLVPITYISGRNNGIITSLSTKRNGFISLEDIYGEVLSIYGREDSSIIGNRIEIKKEKDNVEYVKGLFNKSLNLILLAYLFHGLIYAVQFYIAYCLYKGRKDKLDSIKLPSNFAIINLFIGLLMGLSNFHINIVLYLVINLLVSYIITIFVTEKGINTIGLFATLSYGLILYGGFFNPEILYNSYIGFNNLFYGARYYGFNNGIMGVLLVTSVISSRFIMELIKKKPIRDLIPFIFLFINIIVLSADYGANTGGFIAASALFLIALYFNVFREKWNAKRVATFIIAAIILFSINMYFDYLSYEKSHAINFFIRIRTYGVREFIDMLVVKAKELIKLTILPPFSIVIISQLVALRILLPKLRKVKDEAYIILITSIIAFILNDTGNITFIYMIYYLISFIIHYEEIPSSY